MPQFTYDDRQLLDLEARLWVVRETLTEVPSCHWTEQVNELRKMAETLAKEIQEYHDQWEAE